MANQIEALRERADALLEEARTISSGKPDDSARARFDEIETELDAIKNKREKLERIINAPVRIAPSVGPQVIVRDDPWEGDEARSLLREGPDEIRDRARRAIDKVRDNDAGREYVSGVVEEHRDDTEVARWTLATSHPAYERAFSKLLRFGPSSGYLQFTPEESAAFARAEETRAAMSLTGANGGYLVPFSLDPSVVLTNAGTVGNPVRQAARKVTITTDDWNGVTSAGVSAEWLAEATEAADASPTFTQPQIVVHKAAAYLEASIEVAQDSGVGSDVAMLIADARERLEATAFTTGSGSGQPYGLMQRMALTTASRVAGSSGAAGAADLVAADVYALAEAVPARQRLNASWQASLPVINKVRQFATGTGPQSAFWADFGDGTPSRLLGKAIRENSDMDSTIVSGSNDDVIVIGDFSKYVIVDRIGTSIAYNPLVVGSNRRPTGSVGWFAYWRVGADTVDANAFRSLRL